MSSAEFIIQAQTLIEENDWTSFYPDDFEDAYMQRFSDAWNTEVKIRGLSGNGNAHQILLTRLGRLAGESNPFPLTKTGNRRPPRDRPWGAWGWNEIDEFSVGGRD